jgi:hypothetical protein
MSIFKKTKVVEQETCNEEVPVEVTETSTEIIDEAPNVDHPIVINPDDGEGEPIPEVEDKPEVIIFDPLGEQVLVPHHIRRAKLEYQVI